MKYYFVLYDTNNDTAKTYCVEASDENEACSMFCKRFLPILSKALDKSYGYIDISYVKDLCGDFDFKLIVFDANSVEYEK